MRYIKLLFLGKCHFFYSSVLLVPSALASFFPPHISLATCGSNKALSGNGASISILVMEKIIFRKILMIFTLLSIIVVVVPYAKSGKYCSDQKTLPWDSSFDINEEVDEILIDSSNKKYRIIPIFYRHREISKCTDEKKFDIWID